MPIGSSAAASRARALLRCCSRSPDIEHGSDIPCCAPPPPPPPLPPCKEAGCAIYEVPHRLRKVKEIAYEPYMISIGPYHHGKQHLKAMELIKQSCVDQVLKLTNLEPGEFMKAMKALEERVRKCYGGPVDHCAKFLEMLVYDGCFVVMLINNMYPEDLRKQGRHVQTDMWYDLLLLENQLPFFVLFKLDCLIMRNGEGDFGRDLDRFARLALSSFREGLQCSVNVSYTPPAKDVKHLLDLVHKCCCPPQGMRQQQKFKKVAPKFDRSQRFIHSATELEDAGIGFLCHDQAKEKKNLFDITYITDTGVLSIPTLHVDDNTERLLRNFMAYEQFTQTGEPTYVSDYVVFMDNLINTGKDVQLLCKSGIIDKRSGDDEAVAQMFNKLCDSIRFSRNLRFSDDFYYADTFVRVNKFCKRKWNKERVKRKWKKYNAMLKKDYFNSPWSGCSFAAATVLLLLTLLQTIYTVFSYYQQ
ncbi:hypothetical protein V6N13_040890 [Hibiscus sabdariffa]